MRVKHRTGWWPLVGVQLVAFLSLGVSATPSAEAGAAARDVPLVEAVKAADTAAVRALLAQRIDVDTPEVDGTTALHWAAYQGDLDIAQLLLRAGANADTPNRYAVTPLALACREHLLCPFCAVSYQVEPIGNLSQPTTRDMSLSLPKRAIISRHQKPIGTGKMSFACRLSVRAGKIFRKGPRFEATKE